MKSGEQYTKDLVGVLDKQIKERFGVDCITHHRVVGDEDQFEHDYDRSDEELTKQVDTYIDGFLHGANIAIDMTSQIVLELGIEKLIKGMSNE
jgi:hypothetical protein